MEIVILTPNKELYAGSIESVRVPGTSGQFQVLRGHAPLVSSLGEGVVSVVDTSGQKHEFTIERGFIEVLNNEVSVLVTQENEGDAIGS